MFTSSLVLSLGILATSPGNWPGFLDGRPASIDAQSIPVAWGPEEGIAWRRKTTGYGQSSPVIWADRAYLTSVEGPLKDHLVISAIGLEAGELLWEQRFPTSDPVKSSTFVSRAAPTPVVDQDGVYCFFESGDVVALDHEGQLRWQRSLSRDYGRFENEYGLAASPVQGVDRVVLMVDHSGPSYLIALHKASGKTIWKTERTSRISWSSPQVLEIDGQPQVLCSSAGSIDGYDMQTGEPLWTYEPVGGNRICSPWSFGEGWFLVGSQTSREFPDEAAVRESNFAMRLRQENGNWSPEVMWRTTEASPAMASPMVYAGYAYWINRVGVIHCFEARSGKLAYTERLRQQSWATPLGIGDRVYFFGKDGLSTVLAAGSEFRVLSENWLWDPDALEPDLSVIERETDPQRRAGAARYVTPTVYAVAAVSGTLLIRTGNELHCVRAD